jgi:predicted negative regulator of RcsB-dependent stress response
MKRTERQHLKENELAHSIVAAREFVEARRRQLLGLAVVAIIIAAGVIGISFWKRQSSVAAELALADAMVTMNARVIPPSSTGEQPGEVPAAATIGAVGSYPSETAKLNAALPKLKAAADAYPDTESGITARYHYASALAAVGRPAEAVTAFDDVVKRAGADTLYGRMSRLGKADTQMRAGQTDAAIATWKELAASNDDSLPKDAILMELGHAYVAKGNQEEAKKAFTQIVDEHPTSPYTAEARMELESLKG